MKKLPGSLHIGVIRGGVSPEYEISLKTGENVLKYLSLTHKPIDILITRDGKWHMNGIERTPERILKHVDVVWNALHGTYGEDGKIQELLKHHGVPVTGSDKYESAMAINKWRAKEHARQAGIKTPVAMLVRREDSIEEKAKEIWNSMPHPFIVKPTCGGMSMGVYIAKSFDELLSALQEILSVHGSAIVEEYIQGIDASVLVTEDFRGQNIYAFPPTSKLAKEEKREVEEVAKKVHQMLRLKDLSSSGFVVSPRRGVYFLEVNTSPKFHKESFTHEAIEGVGTGIKDFFHHVIGLALNKK